MTRVINFNPGPATLPLEVLLKVRDDIPEFGDSGMSVMEMSHRKDAFGPNFEAINAETEANLRKVLGIPEDYAVLFLQGGATGMFASIPLNILGKGGIADYVDTGAWAGKAIEEARKYGVTRVDVPHTLLEGNVSDEAITEWARRAIGDARSRVTGINVAASSKEQRYTRIPDPAGWQLTPGGVYVHVTSNETIGGVQYHSVPDTNGVPLVADMSSDFLSRPIDVSQYGLIYAGAQKNAGISGLALVIVRKDLLGKALPYTPSIWDFKKQDKEKSSSATPPTFAIYLTGELLKWIISQETVADLGEKISGLEVVAARNATKADLLYSTIDGSGGFYVNPVNPTDRSQMNVVFTLSDPSLDKEFLEGAKAMGMEGLAGHRSVGGMRASIYNGVNISGVRKLVGYMHQFRESHQK